jgi:hypothetical protein
MGGGDLLNAITENFIGIDQEVLLIVFKSWANWLKWVIKHEDKYNIQSTKTKDTFSRLAEKTGG